MWKFLLLVVLPAYTLAQTGGPVKAVVAKDYLLRIRQANKQADVTVNDSLYNINYADNKTVMLLNRNFPVKRVNSDAQMIKFIPGSIKELMLTGNYVFTCTLTGTIELPELQNTYAQGRSENGSLTWRGAETNELFSYGPLLNTLEFDGSNYQYDISGRLVANGTGNGHSANTYDNSILKTDISTTQDIKLLGRVFKNNNKDWEFSLEAERFNHTGITEQNSNSSKKFAASAGKTLGSWDITANYIFRDSRFNNDNSFGILNRAYQNSLLTPTSFSNSQGNIIGNEQRSYSNEADNPSFLLNSNNYLLRNRHNASISINKKIKKLKIKVTNELETLREKNYRNYNPGAASFQNGASDIALCNNRNYFIATNLLYDFGAHYDNIKNFTLSHIYTNDQTTRLHSATGDHYFYKRSTHDLSLSTFSVIDKHGFTIGAGAGNKAYISNTAAKNYYFLPDISSYLLFKSIGRATVKIFAAYNHSKNELPLNVSFANNNLLLYSTAQAGSYFPVHEAVNDKSLVPVDKKEFSAKIELNHRYSWQVNAEVFIKNYYHQVFPVYENGNLLLKNLADSRTKGMELQLEQRSYSYRNKFSMYNSLTYTLYRNKVTAIENGYNNTPIAGFSNVYKALIVGQPTGVIVGAAYARDANKNIIIGSDGFPLVSGQQKILGDPSPDFTMKLSDNIRYKKWTVNIDWEWQKGADVWNGTQAALDYYGRSAISGQQRNITNYIFTGVKQDGHVNDIPVSFYDPSLPVQNNRWVRYGTTGITEAYIQKADYIKLNTIALAYTLTPKKYIRELVLSAYINGIVLWSANKGAFTDQLLYGQANGSGLNYFNLPATKTYGINISLQF